MKYLYKILRLFYCPHKLVETKRYELTYEGIKVGIIIESKCRYCGKIYTNKITGY